MCMYVYCMCIVCVYCICVLYMCIVCVLYMRIIYVYYICVLYMCIVRVLYVYYICVLYMYIIYVYCICVFIYVYCLIFFSCSCFISNIIVLFTAFLGPIFAVLLFNIVMFLVVILVVIKHCSKRFKDSSKVARIKGACRSLFSILGIMCLFGLTWVFGAFTIKGTGNYFQFLFVIFNSLQGFGIFTFFVVFSKETRDLWQQTCGCKKKKKRETMTSAISASYSKYRPRSRRVTLDENAERLKSLDDVDNESRKMMNSWDIAYIMPQNQFNVLFLSSDTMKRQDKESELKEPDLIPMRNIRLKEPEINEKVEKEEDRENLLKERIPSPAVSMDSTQQNALECLSTADSGILMDKAKSTPSPTMPEGEWSQPDLTPCHHVHSVSGTGYASDESSLETLLPREQDCCYVKKTDPIEIPSHLRTRAIPNDYARLNIEKV